jgi:hypothetical protein
VRLAEAEVRQDFIAQDYDSASGDEEVRVSYCAGLTLQEDDDAKLMRAHRRDKALHQAARQAEAQQDSLMDEIMDDGAAPSAPSAPSAPKGVSSADELMAHLGINSEILQTP